MQLLLVRHALPNRSDHGQGADPDLAREGREQAGRLPGALARFPLARLVSSPQRRAVQTAEPVAAALGLDVEIDDRLAREILSGQVRDGGTVRVDVADDGEGLSVSPGDVS